MSSLAPEISAASMSKMATHTVNMLDDKQHGKSKGQVRGFYKQKSEVRK